MQDFPVCLFNVAFRVSQNPINGFCLLVCLFTRVRVRVSVRDGASRGERGDVIYQQLEALDAEENAFSILTVMSTFHDCQQQLRCTILYRHAHTQNTDISGVLHHMSKNLDFALLNKKNDHCHETFSHLTQKMSAEDSLYQNVQNVAPLYGHKP